MTHLSLTCFALFCAALLTLAWLWRRPVGRWRAPWRGGLALAGVVVLVIAVTAGRVLYGAALRKGEGADAVLILGAAVRNGQPSPALRERLLHGLALHRAGRAPRLLLTGGVGAPGQPAEADVARRFLRERGVADSAMVQEDRSRTTEGNMVYAREEIGRAHV